MTIPYQGILYATDRLPAKGDNSDEFYQDERGHVLRLGVARIKLADENLNWDEAKRISLLKSRGKDYPLSVAGVNELGLLDSSRSRLFESEVNLREKKADAEFAAIVNRKLDLSHTRDVYIYIHGYKVVFSNPLLVASELWHFLGYDGVFLAYAWPSTPSRWAYAKDLETAAYTARNLRLLIEYLGKQTNVNRIHIIAYSAGTRIALDALGQLALMNSGKSKQEIVTVLRIGHVILIGSDSDRDIFGGQLEDGLMNVMEKLTVYMSDTDKALGISNFLFARRRLGQMFHPDAMDQAVQDYLERTEDFMAIDVTNAEAAAAGNGHAYFRKSPWVSSDVLMTLKFNIDPAERGLVRDPSLPIWKFPPDYLDRLRLQLQSSGEL